MSIDRDVLMREIVRILRKYGTPDAEWWLWLIRLVVTNRPEMNCEIHGDRSLWSRLPRNKSLFHSNGRGLPIGNLTSQVFANVYMSMFDRWVIARIGPAGRLSRYVDDFVILSPQRELAAGMVAMARTWLCGNLRLTLHPRKVCVQQVRRGMRFTGMFVKNGLILPSRRLIEGAYRLARGSRGMSREKVAGRMNSRFGLMVHCRSYMLRRRLWRVLAANDNGRFICINHRKLKERKLKNETIHESERTY